MHPSVLNAANTLSASMSRVNFQKLAELAHGKTRAATGINSATRKRTIFFSSIIETDVQQSAQKERERYMEKVVQKRGDGRTRDERNKCKDGCTCSLVN